MTDPAPVIDADARVLAARIYADLLQNVVEVSSTGVQMSADARSVAKVSFKLAVLFREVEDELNAENLPKNQDFKVDIADLAKWNK